MEEVEYLTHAQKVVYYSPRMPLFSDYFYCHKWFVLTKAEYVNVYLSSNVWQYFGDITWLILAKHHNPFSIHRRLLTQSSVSNNVL